MAPSEYYGPANDRATQHDGTQHLAIKNSLFRRWLTLLALRTAGLFYERDGPCVPLPRGYIVKKGPFVHLTEAATMDFVATKTSLPVPRVHCAFIHNNMAHIVMERFEGEHLASAWKSLPDKDIESIMSQLQSMFKELRAIPPPPPGTGVHSCTGGSLTDSRIPQARPRFGPFKTIQEFHAWLREDFNPEDYPDHEEDQAWKDLKEMRAMQDGPWPPSVFTHGDLNPSNILIRGDRVVAIIDWEFAGWYPHYWEYTSAWYGNRLWEEWQNALGKFLDPCPAELRMDITRQKAWGEI